MKIKNLENNQCVICDNKLPEDVISVICMQCEKPCQVTMTEVKHHPAELFGIYDAKSKCCDHDVFITGMQTCSPICHENLIKDLEQQFGIYKQVVDEHSGIAYKVPTRYIIEHGLHQQDLPSFPRWDETWIM